MTDLQILEAYPNAKKFTLMEDDLTKPIPKSKPVKYEQKVKGVLWLSYPKRAMMGSVMANVSVNPVTTLETFLLGTTISEYSTLDMNNDENFYSIMNDIFAWITEISVPTKK